MLKNKKIAFIGAGSMAEAIIAGLIRKEIIFPEQIIATNKSNKERLQYLEKTYGIETTSSQVEAVDVADIVILAMKPKHMEDSAVTIRKQIHEDQLVVSLLAGTSSSYIESLLEKEIAVIRTMPNTSAHVGESATVISKGTFALEEHVKIAATLFQAIGTVTVLEETDMDVVTGISGSGPAYFYYFTEAMEEVAQEAGLSPQDAKELICQTILGVAKRLIQTDKSPKELYEEVMSPGGTTEAAFHVLKENGVKESFKEAIQASIHRSSELGNDKKSATLK